MLNLVFNDFLISLKEFVTKLLGSNFLQTKRIEGCNITGENMLECFKKYAQLIDSNQKAMGKISHFWTKLSNQNFWLVIHCWKGIFFWLQILNRYVKVKSSSCTTLHKVSYKNGLSLTILLFLIISNFSTFFNRKTMIFETYSCKNLLNYFSP